MIKTIAVLMSACSILAICIGCMLVINGRLLDDDQKDYSWLVIGVGTIINSIATFVYVSF